MAAAGLRGNLPAELTSFVGRRRELAEIKRLLSQTRLLTLTGMGGLGKTRLARRLGKEVARAFPDGVWQVELADLHEPALLVHTLADTLGLREPTGRWDVPTLAEHLVDRRLLLILDNCEHLVEPCARMVDALLAGCPQLHVMATSRQPLGIGGERIFRVPPLVAPDEDRVTAHHGVAQYEAVSLFVDRAVGAVPEFVLTSANEATVMRLCQRLEGIPLAIELAANRLRVLSADQLAARLDNRYGVLSGGSRTAPPRQQNLRALVDWSYELCSEPERQLWRNLSVFAGAFELDAAEAMCAGTVQADESVMELVAALLDKSVLLREADQDVARYRMPEVIRSYGQDRLRETGEEPTARRRHRDGCEALTMEVHEHWFGPTQLALYHRIRQEHANIRAALEFSLSESEGVAHAVDMVINLTGCWFALGFVDEARHWLEDALRRSPEPGLTRLRALRGAAYLATLQANTSAAKRMLEEGRVLAVMVGDPVEPAWIKLIDGLSASAHGDFGDACDSYEQARAEFMSSGDDHGFMLARLGLLTAGAALDDHDDPGSRYAEFLALTQARGESWARSYALWAESLEMWRAGDPERSEELALESLRLRLPFNDSLGLGLCVEILAWVALGRDEPERAAELLGCSSSAFASAGSSTAIFDYAREQHELCEASVTQRLSQPVLDAALSRGQQLNINEVNALVTGIGPEPSDAAHQSLRSLGTSPLTRREHEVAELIAHGLSNKDIAARLVIAQRTAEGHVEHILNKLGFTSRAQIAAWVAETRVPGIPSAN